jgi:hypothetical protein
VLRLDPRLDPRLVRPWKRPKWPRDGITARVLCLSNATLERSRPAGGTNPLKKKLNAVTGRLTLSSDLANPGLPRVVLIVYAAVEDPSVSVRIATNHDDEAVAIREAHRPIVLELSAIRDRTRFHGVQWKTDESVFLRRTMESDLEKRKDKDIFLSNKTDPNFQALIAGTVGMGAMRGRIEVLHDGRTTSRGRRFHLRLSGITQKI